MRKKRKEQRERRKKHIRRKVYGMPDEPRVYIYKSNRYVTVGIVNDYENKVLKSMKSEKGVKNAEKLGKKFGKELKKLEIENVVFDRSGYKFHGMVKAVAEGLRSEDINF